MLDKDQPIFHPNDRKNINEYISRIRDAHKNSEDSSGQGLRELENDQNLFNDDEILKYLEKLCESENSPTHFSEVISNNDSERKLNNENDREI